MDKVLFSFSFPHTKSSSFLNPETSIAGGGVGGMIDITVIEMQRELVFRF